MTAPPRRQRREPVEADNMPRPARVAPAGAAPAPAEQAPAPQPTPVVYPQQPAPPVQAAQQPAASAGVDVGTNVGNLVPGQGADVANRPRPLPPRPPSGPPPPADLSVLLYGRADDPSQDRVQTGVRLPRYLQDAVRLTATLSRGRLTMQDIVTDAVAAHLPAEIVRQSWEAHGGAPYGLDDDED